MICNVRPVLLAVIALAMAVSIGGAQQDPVKLDPVDALVVAIPADDEVYVNKDRVGLDRVGAVVDARIKESGVADGVVYIKAGEGVQYGTVVRVIDSIRASGHDRIGLMADPVRKDKPGKDDRAPAAGVDEKPRVVTDTDAVVVHVRTSGRSFTVTIDGVPAAIDQLSEAVRDRLAKRGASTVIVLAPANISYGEALRVIDAVKGAGAEAIATQIDELQSGPKRNPR